MKQDVHFNRKTDVFEYFESLTNLERSGDFSHRHYRPEHMLALLDAFFNPHLGCKTIHVAGTKGKGSTAAFIASILGAGGFKTGLYTSPHVSTYDERITVNGKTIADDIIVSIANNICDTIAHTGNILPTTFEMLTLLAFCVFRHQHCDIAVIEVGIGGRLDATNVVLPEAAVITPIELEHTDVLGSTITEIASEKAGIIKPGIPVFSGFQQPAVGNIIKEKSRSMHAPFYSLDESIEELSSSLSEEGTEVSMKFRESSPFSCFLSMIGCFQAENAALAVLTLRTILPDINSRCYQEGLKKAFLPGRMEIMQHSPPLVIDGAHTPFAVEKALQSFRTLYPEAGILIFGSIKGKNHRKMAEICASAFRTIIVSKPGSFKESDPDALYRLFLTLNPNTILKKHPADALKTALLYSDKKIPILVTGSFYMVSEIRALFISKKDTDVFPDTPNAFSLTD